MSAAKRKGRPFKAPKAGKRAPLSLLVRAEIKAHVDGLARASGRTQSQEAEMLIERCLHYDRMLETMRTTLADIERGNIEAAFRRAGFTPVRTPDGDNIWVPASYEIKRSGFVQEDEPR
jgi:hypothetical protein